MTPATIVRCEDCGAPPPERAVGWLRCPTCETVYCSTCPTEHHTAENGECDSTLACTVCGSTCLIDL